MPIRVVVPPAIEPVTNAQAALWCRAAAEDSTLIDMLIQAARERAENATQRVFVQRTMEWSGPGFYSSSGDWPLRAAGGYDLDYYRAKLSEGHMCAFPQIQLVAPVQSIVSVTYLDASGTSQTLAASSYRLESTCEPAVLHFLDTVPFPTVQSNRSDAVRVRFLAGYPPDDPAAPTPDFRKNLPAALLVWMQVQISTWYTQRESLETGGRLVEASRNFIDGLLDGLIVSTRFGLMLASGLLRERITLESRQTTRDAVGGENVTWQHETDTWAAIDAITGRESAVASQLAAVTSLSVVMRARSDVQPTWRVRWGSRVLSIEAVLPSAKKDRTTLLCSEGLNQTDQ